MKLISPNVKTKLNSFPQYFNKISINSMSVDHASEDIQSFTSVNTYSIVNIGLHFPSIIIKNCHSPEDIIKSLVSDYLQTKFDGLSIYDIEKDYPERTI